MVKEKQLLHQLIQQELRFLYVNNTTIQLIVDIKLPHSTISMCTFERQYFTLKLKEEKKMDQIKIGKFIAECRKKNNLTQMQLADKLNITDRAISKWENGKGMPDSSIMLDLCNELKISVNELLSGEILEMEVYNEKHEQNLIEMIKQKEEADRRLLRLEVIIGVITTIMFFALIVIASVAEMGNYVRFLIIIPTFLAFIAICCVMLRIEQVAGYYECNKCHYKYVPTYLSVNAAPHIGRSRYMKCPKCNKRSWQKKVISKE